MHLENRYIMSTYINLMNMYIGNTIHFIDQKFFLNQKLYHSSKSLSLFLSFFFSSFLFSFIGFAIVIYAV